MKGWRPASVERLRYLGLVHGVAIERVIVDASVDASGERFRDIEQELGGAFARD